FFFTSRRRHTRSTRDWSSDVCSSDLATAQRDPLFKTEILPVLEKSCVQCHGPQRKMAKLDLSTFTGMMEGGSSGPVIAPGKPEQIGRASCREREARWWIEDVRRIIGR